MTSKERDNKTARVKLPSFLSKTSVIIVVCILLSTIFFLAVNFALMAFLQLLETFKSGDISNFQVPGIFTFDFIRLKWAYLITLFLCAGLSLRISYEMKLAYEPLDVNSSKGVRRWTSLEEIKEQYVSIPVKDAFYKGQCGIYVVRHLNRFYIDTDVVNVLIFGPPRSYKGEMIIFPLLDIISRPKRQIDRPDIIVFDPKTELYRSSYQTYINRGYDVVWIDFADFNGIGYNPAEIIKNAIKENDIDTAERYATQLTTDMYIGIKPPSGADEKWLEWSASGLKGILLAVALDTQKKAQMSSMPDTWYDKINLPSCANLVQMFIEDEKNIDLFFKTRPRHDIARISITEFLAAPSKQRGSILSTMLNLLNRFATGKLQRMSLKTDPSFDITKIGFNKEKPTAIFIKASTSDHTYDFLFNIFVNQMYYVMTRTAERNAGNRCDRRVKFVVDEAGNLPPIADISKKVTYSPGYGIDFTFVFHGYGQMENVYHKAGANAIKEGCGNKYILGAASIDGAEEMAREIGNTTVVDKTRHGEPLQLDKHYTSHSGKEQLFSAGEIQQLKVGECIVLRTQHRLDNNGKEIVPTPIFCTKNTKMKPRYKYLTDTFPNPETVTNTEIGLDKKPVHADYLPSRYIYDVDIADVVREHAGNMSSVLLAQNIQGEQSENPAQKGVLQYSSLYMPEVEEEKAFITLPKQVQEQLLMFFEMTGVTDERLQTLPEMTLTEFDGVLQTMIGDKTITQTTYDDVYTILDI